MNMKYIVALFALIITKLSPEIKELLKKSLDNLEAKAKLNSNPFDDMLVQLLRETLNS